MKIRAYYLAVILVTQPNRRTSAYKKLFG